MNDKTFPLQARGAWRPLSPRRYRVDAQRLACDLLGRWLCRKDGERWLALAIVECEAYYLDDKASHSSLGHSPSRHAMFMPPGTIYMYHSQGGDSLNLSASGKGNAVLIKAARVPDAAELGWDQRQHAAMVQHLHRNNPPRKSRASTPTKPEAENRPLHRLASGQALLCRALRLSRRDWNEKRLDPQEFYIARGKKAKSIVVCPRLGIAAHRDPHLMLRFVDAHYAVSATKNPLRQRNTPHQMLSALP